MGWGFSLARSSQKPPPDSPKQQWLQIPRAQKPRSHDVTPDSPPMVPTALILPKPVTRPTGALHSNPAHKHLLAVALFKLLAHRLALHAQGPPRQAALLLGNLRIPRTPTQGAPFQTGAVTQPLHLPPPRPFSTAWVTDQLTSHLLPPPPQGATWHEVCRRTPGA